MPNSPRDDGDLAGGHFARRMAMFYASTFVVLGVYLPFLPLWLAAKGLEAGTIGIVLAMPMGLRLVAIPLATRAADRRDALRAVIMAATLAALVGFATLAFTTDTLTIAVLYALSATAFMLLFVLSDVYALRGLAAHRRAYGPVRLWGSAAFIVSNLTAGYLFDIIAARDLIWLIVIALALCLVAAWGLPPLAPAFPSHGERASTPIRDELCGRGKGGATTGETTPARVLLRDPAFIAVVATASLIQGSHALYYSFSTIDWQASGFGGGTIGVLWGLGVFAEIVLFALSARLPAAFTPSILMLIGGIGALVRWIAMALGPPGALLPLLQCLHGLSFGATHLGTLAFIGRAAPRGLAATAQGYLAVSMGVAMAASTGLSGLFYGRFGAAAYGAMALIAAAGIAAALMTHRMQRGVDNSGAG
ncbi:MAG: MFS transporter [Rhizobiales bacterium]|nr:MFS transporter [Hyphomicrobiales bacterium]